MWASALHGTSGIPKIISPGWKMYIYWPPIMVGDEILWSFALQPPLQSGGFVTWLKAGERFRLVSL